jgi:hypothetical protein
MLRTAVSHEQQKRADKSRHGKNLDMMGNEEDKPRPSLSSNIVSATGAT